MAWEMIDAIIKAKPPTSKANISKKVAVSSTMGPGVQIDVKSKVESSEVS